MPVEIRDRGVLLLLDTTGIRNGELRDIQLQDIDWQTGEVFVRRTKASVIGWCHSLRRPAPHSPLHPASTEGGQCVSVPVLHSAVRPFNSASATVALTCSNPAGQLHNC
ncbi:tyrosine-type recombinase/integrase [Ensifer aridi]|uniref:tyrosine-type recombinase/integrase n=1 Tax=Ensifer aridi TaxID=1708715 RepID=UPI001FD89AEE|nr:tyrosine-type recombinase/integrase [Ensifer aridi]